MLNLFIEQLLELAAGQPALGSLPGADQPIFRRLLLHKQLVQHMTIKFIREWQPHTLQQCWDNIKNLGIGRFETALETGSIGIEDAIFLVRTKGLANVLPNM